MGMSKVLRDLGKLKVLIGRLVLDRRRLIDGIWPPRPRALREKTLLSGESHDAVSVSRNGFQGRTPLELAAELGVRIDKLIAELKTAETEAEGITSEIRVKGDDPVIERLHGKVKSLTDEARSLRLFEDVELPDEVGPPLG